MAKVSGGTRNNRERNGKTVNVSVSRAEQQIKEYAKDSMQTHQTEDDIRKFDEKRLMQLIRVGNRYRDGLLEEVVQQAIDADKQGKRWNTGLAEGFKSEINRVANLKKMYDNIPTYQKILKEKRKS